MLYTIQNDILTVSAETAGAELRSIRSAQIEYLWQGDSRTWRDHAPTLFPYVGRATGGHVRYRGKRYPMPIHGLAPTSEFTLVEKTMASMTMLLASSEKTLACYPFAFRFYVTWTLHGSELELRYRVCSDTDETMYFGLGAHPGIRVPLEPHLRFEDYCLRFAPGVQPVSVGLSDDCFPNGDDHPFALENGDTLPLRHTLFDRDAIVLKNAGHHVTLCSSRAAHGVTVSFPDQAYFGIWQWPKSEASYVCLEPWSSLPSHKGIEEDLQTQPTLLSLAPHGEYQTHIRFEFT